MRTVQKDNIMAGIAKPRSRATRPKRTARPSAPTRDVPTASNIRFSAKLLRPAPRDDAVDWTFLLLPANASNRLPSRGMMSVEGTFNGVPFQATLDPDGQGGHWLKVNPTLQEAAGATPGDRIPLEIRPMADEPEPAVPPDVQQALAVASAKARTTWSDITPAARRDWIHWITSGKRAETRHKRTRTACDMLAKGKRRPCCFDRSGMYSKSLSCPLADENPS